MLFTSDIHSYFYEHTTTDGETIREHGGAARLETLIEENRNDHMILVDAGDFAMGTLLGTGFSSQAYELRLLGQLGYTATTFGNHEFDFGGTGAASMLRAAAASDDPLPWLIIPANLDLTGNLTGEQREVWNALNAMGSATYKIVTVDGIDVAIFALLGKNAISCAPTSGLTWKDPITSAKEVVKQIGDQADVIVCISHSGTDAAGTSGEDIDLAKAVPEIDVVISGHTHVTHEQAVYAGNAVLGSCGAYLKYLGRMDLTVSEDGKVTCDHYELIPCDATVEGDAEMAETVSGYLAEVSESYLQGSSYDEVIAHTDFPILSSEETDIGRGEIPLGTLIADSYLYACRENGYPQAQIGLVGLGTIRRGLNAGDITVGDAFEVCSLGVGSDGSAGHNLVMGYLYGRDLKLLAEFDALIGEMMPSVKMSYAGLSVTFDVNRIPLDRVTSMQLLHEDGTTEPLQMDQLYCVVGNMYAINMFTSIRSMTYGLVNLNPLDENGQVITDLYSAELYQTDGTGLKEWIAFRDYLSSFDKVDGVSQIPTAYSAPQGRKVVTESHGLAIFANPGLTTWIVLILMVLIVVLIIFLIVTHKRRKLRRQQKRLLRQQKKLAKKEAV